jgi:hypothetical protein
MQVPQTLNHLLASVHSFAREMLFKFLQKLPTSADSELIMDLSPHAAAASSITKGEFLRQSLVSYLRYTVNQQYEA